MDNEPASYTIAQAREFLTDVLNRAAYGKERVLITRRNKPLAYVVPIRDVEALNGLSRETVPPSQPKEPVIVVSLDELDENGLESDEEIYKEADDSSPDTLTIQDILRPIRSQERLDFFKEDAERFQALGLAGKDRWQDEFPNMTAEEVVFKHPFALQKILADFPHHQDPDSAEELKRVIQVLDAKPFTASCSAANCNRTAVALVGNFKTGAGTPRLYLLCGICSPRLIVIDEDLSYLVAIYEYKDILNLRVDRQVAASRRMCNTLVEHLAKAKGLENLRLSSIRKFLETTLIS